MGTKLKIRLIGAFTVTDADNGPCVISGRKDRAVLAFLATHPGRSIARSRLVELIWPMTPDGAGRASLRQSISTIRKSLPDGDVLRSDRDTVTLREIGVVTDIQLLERRTPELGPMGRMPLASGEAFLDDLSGVSADFDTWRTTEQSRVTALVSVVLGDVIRHAENTQDQARALVARSQLAALDPLNEEAIRDLMTALIQEGQPNAAIRHFRALEVRLTDELDVRPEAATQEVFRTARAKSTGTSNVRTAVTPSASTPTVVDNDLNTLTIVPFRDLSNEEDKDQFASWLTESLTTTLSQISGLHVSLDPRVDSLDVSSGEQCELHGTVRRAQDRLRVAARLICVPSGQVLWAEQYDHDLGDVFQLQDDIAHRITVEMRVKLSEGEKVRALQHRGGNLEIWRMLLRADTLTNTLVEVDNIEARALLEQAVAIDPNYAPAWSQMADTYIGDYMMARTSLPRREYLAKAEHAANQALAADASYVSAQNIIGYVRLFRGEHDLAADTLREAMARAPRNSEVVATCAYVLAFCGKIDEAKASIERAIKLTPIAPMWYVCVLGLCEYLDGNWQTAIDQLRTAVRMESESAFPRPYLIGALMEVGASETASGVVGDLLRIEPGFTVSNWPGADFRELARKEKLVEALVSAGLKH